MRLTPAQVLLCLASGACGRIGFDPLATDAAASDAADAADGACIDRWRAGSIALDPISIMGLGMIGSDSSPFLIEGGQTLYFRSTRGGLSSDIYVAARDGPASYGSIAPVTEINSSSEEFTAALAPDGLTIYFTTDRPGTGFLGANLWQATRSGTGQPFSNLDFQAFTNINTDLDEYEAFISQDELRIYTSHYIADQEIHVASRATKADPFGPSTLIAELHDGFSQDCCPTLSEDELVIVFSSRRGGTPDLYYATRDSLAQPFSPPQPLPGANDPVAEDKDPFLSPGGCFLYFASNRAPDGQLNIYVSAIGP